MKNFKKVIAFLMVAAMTLGMGLTAFADAEDLFEAGKVEAVDEGTVTISIIAKESMSIEAAEFTLELDPEFVEADADAIKAVNEVKNDIVTVFPKAYGFMGGGNVIVEDEMAKVLFAGISGAGSDVEAGDVLASIVIPVKKALAEGDVIGSFVFPKTFVTGDGEVLPAGMDVVVSAKVTEPDPGPTDPEPTDPVPGPTDPTQAPAPTQADTNANNAAQPTTKALPKAEDIKNVTNALEACADLAGNGNYSAVLGIAKKLDASCFTSKDNYNAFSAALKDYEAVINKAGATDAEKVAAYNKLITLMQENLLTQKGKDTLMNAVKAALSSAPAATKTGKGGKTGDTAPVAALMVVAIAAFGTAVVVYRKKVNA